MNVLSLFDGMSCGQLALNRAGIKYDNYYASEIKKFAIELTKHHYPNTIHVGDGWTIDVIAHIFKNINKKVNKDIHKEYYQQILI